MVASLLPYCFDVTSSIDSFIFVIFCPIHETNVYLNWKNNTHLLFYETTHTRRTSRSPCSFSDYVTSLMPIKKNLLNSNGHYKPAESNSYEPILDKNLREILIKYRVLILVVYRVVRTTGAVFYALWPRVKCHKDESPGIAFLFWFRFVVEILFSDTSLLFVSFFSCFTNYKPFIK